MGTYTTVSEWEAKHYNEMRGTHEHCSDYQSGVLEAMYQTLYALGDFATACSGLGSERMTPEEMFDRVARNLAQYYNQVLERKEFDEN